MSNEAFAAWVEVLPDFKNFRKTANSEMSSVLGAAGSSAGLSAGSSAGAGILSGIKGIAGPLVGVVAALGIGKLVGDAIGTGINYALDSVPLASNLAETKSAIKQVFGDGAGVVEEFAATAATSLGQTRVAALKGAQTFGVFGKAAGLSGDALGSFSTDLVTLAGDFASFYNTSPAEAIDAIGAGLRGESEPLRRYGVLLDDAVLKQRAVTLGIYDGTGALSQQQRVLAAQAEILAQSTIAQGDFARTSDGLANQQRILQASLEETQTKLGEALLPAFTGLVGYANENLIPKLDGVIERLGPKIADAIDEATPKIEQLIEKSLPLLDFAVDKGLPAFLDAVNNAVTMDDIEGFTRTADDLNAFFTDYLPRWASGSVPVKESWDGFFEWWDMAWDGQASTVFNKSDEIKFYWGHSLDELIAMTKNAREGAFGAGVQFAAGFGDGIETEAESAALAAERMALRTVQKVRGALQIESPSRVMRELGGYTAEGFALGISDGTLGVTTAVQSMVAIPTAPSPTAMATTGATSTTGTAGITLVNPDPYVLLAMLKQELGGKL